MCNKLSEYEVKLGRDATRLSRFAARVCMSRRSRVSSHGLTVVFPDFPPTCKPLKYEGPFLKRPDLYSPALHHSSRLLCAAIWRRYLRLLQSSTRTRGIGRRNVSLNLHPCSYLLELSCSIAWDTDDIDQ